MERKAVGACVLCNARKRTQDTYREREGSLPRCFWIRALSTQQGGYVRYTITNLIIIIIIMVTGANKTFITIS